jgi:tRNA-specific 2-thiouridylase
MWLFILLATMIRRPGRGKSVAVGVSGGVDSSVAALLLKLAGYQVTGVFIRTWQPDWIECTWRDERRDAMRVCAHLQIPFVELNLQDEYKRGVADYMIAEYRKGRTPNPDVMCNREVKFGGFLKWAMNNNFDFIATGHYAQKSDDHLMKGNDRTKDQTYFLWTLTKEQLAKTLFPVGRFYKRIVRTIAKLFNMPTAVKKDSQGICFIGDINMKDFLRHYIEEKAGDVLDETGKVIGTHNGVLFYTLGERHGFVITSKGTDDRPYYVVGKNSTDNTLIVSQNDPVISGKEQIVELENLVLRENLNPTITYDAQIRYHGDLKPCKIISLMPHTVRITFFNTDHTIASGQSVVLYLENRCIGGGVVS